MLGQAPPLAQTMISISYLKSHLAVGPVASCSMPMGCAILAALVVPSLHEAIFALLRALRKGDESLLHQLLLLRCNLVRAAGYHVLKPKVPCDSIMRNLLSVVTMRHEYQRGAAARPMRR